MKNLILVVCSFGMVFLVSTASALSIKDYKAYRKAGGDEWTIAQSYLHGLGNGFEWANVELDGRKQKKLFCVPGKLALHVENYVSILDTTMESHPKPAINDDSLVEFVLLVGLQETFPCK